MYDGFIILQGPFTRQQVNPSAEGVSAVIERDCQCVEDGIERDYNKGNHEKGI